MARQRYRVWTARLIALLFIATIVAAGLRWWWLSVTKSEVALPQTTLTQPSSPPENPIDVVASVLAHPLDEVLELAREALRKHRENHQDYTATLLKTERIGKVLAPSNTIFLKLRYNPLQSNEASRSINVYLKFLEPKAQAGREVLFAPERNNGMLKAHEGGLLGLLSVDLTPNSVLAMRGNRHPITELGIEKLLTKLIEKGERDRKLGDCQVVRTDGETIDGRPCERIDVIHPQKRVIHEGEPIDHEFFMARIWFDKEKLIPLKYASYAWPLEEGGEPLLEEEYTYMDLKLNVGLDDEDFDVNNPDYRFP
ncbi:MAG: DUF1571 domain-containing protein [Pirellula sp.]|nr:DUF1571 domain-containing protein [Pirellula sp.]